MPSDYKAITEYNEDQLGKDTSSRKTQVSMYSDPTHFVYEILQNADDYGATEILFKLSEAEIVIEHNAEPFKEKHVRAITYFGKSTSREDLVKTGRFGIGFKSVFAFTASPIIISGSEHFRIYGLYRVREYPYPDGFSRFHTRIILPFNHESEQPDFVEELMSKQEAYGKIEECLTNLDMNTLLFTRNIREIRWEIEDQSQCYSREDKTDDNARLTTIRGDKNENTYLVFSKIPTWENEEHKAVEIAFAVDNQHQLSPITDDILHVLFPTRERTDLRFILNGPYRTNPARETISSDDPFNRHLMKVTCRLMKEVLRKLRDKKLLTVQSLAILPNEEDGLSRFYDPLRDLIVDEFQNAKLTPAKRGDYAPALELYRDRNEGELSGLIQDKDLAILLKRESSQPLWVANLPPRIRNERGQFIQDENARRQNERINNFLIMLGVSEWAIEDFIEIVEAEPDLVTGWLKDKGDQYHQRLYLLLGEYLSSAPSSPIYISRERKDKLSNLPIVRCSDGEYRIGNECHFPTDDNDDIEPITDLLADNIGIVDGIQLPTHKDDEDEKNFNYVAKDICFSGRNSDTEKVYKFLEDIGVCEVDETERIKLILKERYKDSIKPRAGDMERFISLVEREPDKTALFENYRIFKCSNGHYLPSVFLFLDSPYLDTGLTVCREVDVLDCFISHGFYNGKFYQVIPKYQLQHEELGIDSARLGRFAEAIGVKTKLEPIEQNIPTDHPDYRYLVTEAPGKLVKKTSIDVDYKIEEFEILLNKPSVEKSRLIWRTMINSVSAEHLQAEYRNNAAYPLRFRESSLVHNLRKTEWVPQKSGDPFSFVCPKDASPTLLPEDFPYDAGQKWLEAIEFGEIANKQREERRQYHEDAKNFGFDSADEASTMAEIANALKDQGKSPDELRDKLFAGKRRKERILIELEDAPEKEYHQRQRNVRTTIGTIDRRTHLREQYTTDDKKMKCQMCWQDMPFKKRNSAEDYFEAVEALKKDHFPKEHEAQHLALCPECAARYKEFVKRDKNAQDSLYDALKNSDNPQNGEKICIQVLLKSDSEMIRICFKEKHWQDLKTVVYYYENVYDPDESD